MPVRRHKQVWEVYWRQVGNEPERQERRMQKAYLTVKSSFLALVSPRTCLTPRCVISLLAL